MKWIFCFLFFTFACRPSEQAQRQQDSIRTVQEQKQLLEQARKDSLARVHPEQYLSVKLDTIHVFQRSTKGDEIEFSIDNQTPLVADSLIVHIHTQALQGFRNDSTFYRPDTIKLQPVSVSPKSRQRFTAHGHFKSVDSLVITEKHFH
jgi:hypothetical protein